MGPKVEKLAVVLKKLADVNMGWLVRVNRAP